MMRRASAAASDADILERHLKSHAILLFVPAILRVCFECFLDTMADSMEVANGDASSGPVPPNQTLYIRNINEKIKKDGTFISGLDPLP